MTPFDESAAVEAMARAIFEQAAMDSHIIVSPWQGQDRAEFRRQAKSALSALRPFLGDGWRTMESAPKDGTWIDLWTARHFETGQPERMAGCRWGHPIWHRKFGPFPDDVPDGFECWVDGMCHGVADPSHWRPLPAQPDSGKEG